jgi:hypothetical protein
MEVPLQQRTHAPTAHRPSIRPSRCPPRRPLLCHNVATRRRRRCLAGAAPPIARRRMVRATRVAEASQATTPGDQVHLQFPDGGGCVQADHVRVRRRQLRQELRRWPQPRAAPIVAAANANANANATDNKSIDN